MEIKIISKSKEIEVINLSTMKKEILTLNKGDKIDILKNDINDGFDVDFRFNNMEYKTFDYTI